MFLVPISVIISHFDHPSGSRDDTYLTHFGVSWPIGSHLSNDYTKRKSWCNYARQHWLNSQGLTSILGTPQADTVIMVQNIVSRERLVPHDLQAGGSHVMGCVTGPLLLGVHDVPMKYKYTIRWNPDACVWDYGHTYCYAMTFMINIYLYNII